MCTAHAHASLRGGAVAMLKQPGKENIIYTGQLSEDKNYFSKSMTEKKFDLYLNLLIGNLKSKLFSFMQLYDFLAEKVHVQPHIHVLFYYLILILFC